MGHEDPTLDVEAALRDEEELANLAELGAAWTPEDEQPSATPPDAAPTPGETGSDAEKAPSGPPQKEPSGCPPSVCWPRGGGGAGARQRSCRRGLLGVSAEGDPAPGRL